MTLKTEAVFQGGVFRPTTPVDVPENERVLLEVVRLPGGRANGAAASNETSDAWIARWRTLVASMPDVHGVVDDDRESIYAGRGE